LLNKVLVSCFIALFILVFLEIIYLIFPKILPKSAKTLTTASTTPSSQPQPTPLTLDTNSVQRSKYPAAFQQPIFRGLMAFRKNDVISGTVDVKYRGKIASIDNKPGLIQKSNFSYVKSVKIKGSGNYYEFLYLSQDAFGKTTVVKNTGSTEAPITFGDLKVGDQIIIQQVIDLTKQPGQSSKSVKIIKI
jgi:hypothetical protein